MEALALLYKGETLRHFSLGEAPLEVGSGAGVDIVVHDAGLAPRHYLVCRDGQEVTAFDVRSARTRTAPRSLLPGSPLALGRHHSLVRLAEPPSGVHRDPVKTVQTEVIFATASEPDELSLLVGRGVGARALVLGGRPLTVGSGPCSDLVLSDRAVSAAHFRIEPGRIGATLRDLGSRNGTYVDGVRTLVGRLSAGMRVRAGRTDLFVAARGHAAPVRRSGLIAASSEMHAVLAQVDRVAHRSWPTLVCGESGVGKEGIAHALHTRSGRASGPFVAVNAGGLPRDLVESELFGHEKGSFTGASSLHRGVFEQASGGTLFLDEIGELSPELQVRLLRVIETGQIRRVGGEALQPVEVRLVCATHRNLKERAQRGLFRADLYYRIAQVVIEVPPLRRRPEDIRALAEHFLEEAQEETGARRLGKRALDALLAHPWPGNVRELKSVVRCAAVECAGQIIDHGDVSHAIERLSGGLTDAVEEGSMGAVLERHGGNLSAAARALGLPRTTLRDRVRRSEPPPEGRAHQPYGHRDDDTHD